MTPEQRAIFEAWIIENVDDRVVPSDEGNGDALVYNLIHLLRSDGQRYDYLPSQDEELRSWGLGE